MIKKYSNFFSGLTIFFDALAIAGIYYLAFLLRYILPIGGLPSIPSRFFIIYRQFALIIIPVLIFSLYISKAYTQQIAFSFPERFFSNLKGCSLAFLIILGITSFYREISFSRLILVYFYFLTIIFLPLYRSLILNLLKYLFRISSSPRRLLIVGTTNLAFQVSESVKNNISFRYEIAGHLGTKTGQIPEVLGSITDLEQIIIEYNIDDIIIAISQKEQRYINNIIKTADKEGIRIRIIPDIIDMVSANSVIETIDGLPVITISEFPLDKMFNSLIKRIFDLITAFFLLVIFSPIMLLIALLIKILSRGEVFFIQERLSVNNDPFFVIKFRTMHIQEKQDSDTMWTKENDQRVFAFGKFLRKTSIDELPQLFNILLGNMSMVGPRPERPYFVTQFKEKIPYYMQRHRVKAGLTGWAQINGFRGDTAIDKRIGLDLYYIENWSFYFDLKILILTIPAMIFSKNAY